MGKLFDQVCEAWDQAIKQQEQNVLAKAISQEEMPPIVKTGVITDIDIKAGKVYTIDIGESYRVYGCMNDDIRTSGNHPVIGDTVTLDMRLDDLTYGRIVSVDLTRKNTN